jgi:hypothetical protein
MIETLGRPLSAPNRKSDRYRAPNITAAKIKATPHNPMISNGGT